MILGPLAWFWVAYYSIGLYVLMEAIVIACTVEKDINWVIKCIAIFVAVSIWPVVFIKNKP